MSLVFGDSGIIVFRKKVEKAWEDTKEERMIRINIRKLKRV